VSVSIWWAVFTIPLILNVKEPGKTGDGRGNTLKAAYNELSNTFHNIRRYRELTIFLIAFLIYNDGIGTIIKMATIYGTEIGIGRNDLIGALLMTQFVGIPFAFGFGRFAKTIGTKNCIYIGLIVYTVISIGGYFISTAIDFWILAFLVGTMKY